MAENELRSLSAGLPIYSDAREFMRIANGVSYTIYSRLIEIVWEQRGNPQEQVDWMNPEDWIPERLKGPERAMALSFWRESKGRINPRYLHHFWRFVKKHNLMVRNGDIISLTERGQDFLKDDPKLILAIDIYEGVVTILQIVAERGPGKRGDFWNDYAEFCQTYTPYRSEHVIAGTMYDRLMNLIGRGYVTRNGQTYKVTDAGLAYLDTVNIDGGTDKQAELLQSAKKIKEEVRARLYDQLTTMNPFKFESLVKLLLERMGYENVETTTPTNDKGVDVVADIQLGISRVREVVQVKRHRGNIGRPVLDGLRGSLHRFRAVRGTIITTGGFSKGTEQAAFEIGAAPITLIDGERLLDLLIEYGIGIKKRQVEYFEFDESDLAQLESKAGDGPVDAGEQE